MSFVETDSGWINTAHVVRAVLIRDEHKRGSYAPSRYELYAHDRLLGIATRDGWLAATSPVVPAAPGVTAYLVVRADARGKASRPTEQDVCVTPQLVVAWRMMLGFEDVEYAYPILPEPPLSGTAILVQMPYGKLLRCDCGDFSIYDDIHTATAAVLSRLQDDWDMEHASEDTAA